MRVRYDVIGKMRFCSGKITSKMNELIRTLSKDIVTPLQGLNPRRPFVCRRGVMRVLDAVNLPTSFNATVVFSVGGAKNE